MYVIRRLGVLGVRIVITQNILQFGVMSETQFSWADIGFVGNGHLLLNEIAHASRLVKSSGRTPIAFGIPSAATAHTSNTKNAVAGPIKPGSRADWMYHKNLRTALYTACVRIAQAHCLPRRYMRFARNVFAELRAIEAAAPPVLVWTDVSEWCGATHL